MSPEDRRISRFESATLWGLLVGGVLFFAGTGDGFSLLAAVVTGIVCHRVFKADDEKKRESSEP